MDRFNPIAVALSLACLAGIDLYLTVFATGLAIHFHWIALSPQYQSLDVLGQPWIIIIAGILYLLEFLADKIPWIDSAWDTVHTIIRPIGGALLALQVFGHHSPVVDVLIILLGGSASLITHTAKASTRLAANSSPEPASNIGLSVAEDVAVFGGLTLIHYNPILALSIFVVAIAAFLYFAPKVFRSMKAKVWLALHKLNAAPDVRRAPTLPIALPSRLSPIFSKQNLLGETIAWAVPCVSGRGRRIPANVFGALVATNEEPHKIVFVGRKNWKSFSQTIDLEGSTIAREPQFLSENLVIVPKEGRGPKYSFLFTRSRGALVELIAQDLREKMRAPSSLDVEALLASASSRKYALCTNPSTIQKTPAPQMQLASRYSQLRDSARVHETSLFPALRTLSELELQARWFAGDFGRRFTSTTGDEIEIVQFGTWNREAGPDFSDAAIRINGSDPLRGTIEFDLNDRSWETHGHSTNPAFDDAILHVFVEQSNRTFFTRTKSNRNVPQVRVDPAMLPEKFSAVVPLARPGRCQAPLKDLPQDRLESILTAASQFRLQRKAARLKNIVENHGRDAALFQEIAAALGYKQNKLAFTLLAQRLPLASLRKIPDDLEAILFGVAGFLGAPDLAAYREESRGYVRNLWDRWWPHRDAMQRLVLPAKLWRLGGARPLNHPQRRLGALAILAKQWPAFIKAVSRRQTDMVHDFFLDLRHPFWSFRYTLTSDAASSEMAIIGDSRIADILANVLLPYFLAEGAEVWPAYEKLPARLTNRRLETGATRLFGGDPRRPQFTKTIAQQQGLLQIYEDFCLQDNSDCAQCPFPEQMLKWK